MQQEKSTPQTAAHSLPQKQLGKQLIYQNYNHTIFTLHFGRHQFLFESLFDHFGACPTKQPNILGQLQQRRVAHTLETKDVHQKCADLILKRTR